MKRRSKLSIQVYRAITVTAIGLMIGAAPMRVMTVQAQETEKNQEQQSYDQKLDYKVFEDSSERLLEWSDINMLSNEDIRFAKNEIYARHGRQFVTDYIADYFTFPHNNHYPGNVKDHCYYERDLKYGMKAFLKTEEALKIKEQVVAYDSVEELTSYIRSIHNSYMKLAHTVEEDIRYIVHACTTVVKSILNMVSYAFSTSVANIQYV